MAVATPCWPAPVSATSRVLPMRLASRAWPSTLLILCEPVWLRSSRLSSSRRPSSSAEVGALGEQRGPAGVVAQQPVVLAPEPRVGPRLAEGGLELLAGRDERLGHEQAAEAAEPAARPGVGHERGVRRCRGARWSVLRRGSGRVVVHPVEGRRPGRATVAAEPPAATGRFRVGQLGQAGRLRRRRAACGRPCGRATDSTPVATSTPHGRTWRMASPTLSGVRPPARITLRCVGAPSASDQSNTSPEPGVAESTRMASAP